MLFHFSHFKEEKKNKVAQNRHAEFLIVSCLQKKKRQLSSFGSFMSSPSSGIPPLPADLRHVCFRMTCAAALQPTSVVSLTLPPAAVCSPLSPSTFRHLPRAILLRMFLPAVFSSSSLCFELLTPSAAWLELLRAARGTHHQTQTHCVFNLYFLNKKKTVT